MSESTGTDWPLLPEPPTDKVQAMTSVSTDEARVTSDADAGVVRIMLVDDHEMVIQGLASVLNDESDLEVVYLAAAVADALGAAVRVRPDVVIMDYHLQDGDGVDAARRLIGVLPEVSVIMLTAASDDNTLVAALAAGCCGFVVKGSSIEELLRTVRAAATGGGVFAPEIINRLVRLRRDGPSSPALSPREQEVLELVAAGQNTGAIALMLGLSQHTVRNHIRNVLSKLGAHSQLEAVVVATRANLIQAPGR